MVGVDVQFVLPRFVVDEGERLQPARRPLAVRDEQASLFRIASEVSVRRSEDVLRRLLDLAAEDIANIVAEAVLKVAFAAVAELGDQIAIRQQVAGDGRHLRDHQSVRLQRYDMSQARDPDIRLEVAVLDVFIEEDVEQLGMQGPTVQEETKVRTALFSQSQFHVRNPVQLAEVLHNY